MTKHLECESTEMEMAVAPPCKRAANGYDYERLAERLAAIPRDEFGDPLDSDDDVFFAALAAEKSRVKPPVCVMAAHREDVALAAHIAHIMEEGGAVTAASFDELDDDWPPVDNDFDGLDCKPMATAFDDGWDDPWTDLADPGFMEKRDGAIFLRDQGDGPWNHLQPIRPRRRSRRVRLLGPEFNRRINQLARSWGCSFETAENHFWSVNNCPKHEFPPRRTRQFEE